MATQLQKLTKRGGSNRWLLGALAAGLLGLGAFGMLTWRQQSAAPDISTMTVPVEETALTLRIAANGRVQPARTVNLSPKNAGILAELMVEQGDRVQQGQLIARMEGDDIGAQLTQSRARVAQAQAQLAERRAGNLPEDIAQRQAEVEQAQAQVAEADARVALADTRLQRNRTLQSEGAISLDDLDAATREADSARANLELTRANLRATEQRLGLSRSGTRVEQIAAAEAQVQEALGNLQAVEVRQQDTEIRAPFDGIITQRYASEGSFVTPTTSASDASAATSTAIVAVAEGLEVLAEVPEVDIGQLQVGQRVEVQADALPNQVFEGRVRLVAPEAVVQQNVTSFQVRVDLLTGQERLLSGMNVDVTFLGDRVENTLAVPTVAIVTQDGQSGVLVPDDRNRPEFRPVTLGIGVGNQTQVIDGVEPGDRIFVDLPPRDAQRWMNPNQQN
ncbi:MAG: efflux RND transporter periplasmic adaptor subunit [Kaiparowitsia implicata GSE-PSE-MK54-09C]|jgi:HlyD family secretion protein|nr:efflux RND transporter periplasmic adaptor subunit [Kaiparowitsia implicata GSE-PSE-MK54-09C]